MSHPLSILLSGKDNSRKLNRFELGLIELLNSFDKEFEMVQRWLESDLDTLFTSKEPLELGRLDVEDFFAELAKLLRARASNDNEVTG